MSKTRLEKFLELNLRIHKLVDEANNAMRVPGMSELYYLKVNNRRMGEVMQRRKNADHDEMVNSVLFPKASTSVQ